MSGKSNNYVEIEIFYFKKLIDKLILLLSSALFILKKRIMILLITLVLGFILGFINFIKARPYYETHLTATSAIIPNIIISKITNNLDTIINADNVDILAGILKIKKTEASKIINISSKEVYKTDTSFKTIISLEHIDFVIQTLDSSINPLVKEKLMTYLSNNEYIKRRFDLYKKEYFELISKIDQSRFKLTKDSSMYVLRNFGNQKVVERLLPDKFIHLMEEDMNFEKSIELKHPIEVIDEFTVKRIPKSQMIWIYWKLSLAIGLVLIVLLELYKRSSKPSHS